MKGCLVVSCLTGDPGLPETHMQLVVGRFSITSTISITLTNSVLFTIIIFIATSIFWSRSLTYSKWKSSVFFLQSHLLQPLRPASDLPAHQPGFGLKYPLNHKWSIECISLSPFDSSEYPLKHKLNIECIYIIFYFSWECLWLANSGWWRGKAGRSFAGAAAPVSHSPGLKIPPLFLSPWLYHILLFTTSSWSLPSFSC